MHAVVGAACEELDFVQRVCRQGAERSTCDRQLHAQVPWAGVLSPVGGGPDPVLQHGGTEDTMNTMGDPHSENSRRDTGGWVCYCPIRFYFWQWRRICGLLGAAGASWRSCCVWEGMGDFHISLLLLVQR